MKETPLSLCERSSVLTNLQSQIRLDSRKFLEIRNIKINFGKDYGCCTVALGETRVLAQVSCEIVEPRPSRPNEGKLSVAVHLSPMAAPHFEPGKGNELMDDLQQTLDRNIKDSKCLDLESLCIMAEYSVWQLKIDVTVLNHAGNLADACNLAAVSALRHFHRPDVTVEEDGRVTIHTEEEKKFIPTFLKKIPICLSYGLFMVDSQCIVVIDPTEKEERVMDGKLSVGLNPHGEITSLIFSGKVCLERSQILNIVHKSLLQAKAIAETVIKVVTEDLEDRKVQGFNKPIGFVKALTSDEDYVRNMLIERVQRIQRLDISQNVEEEEMEADNDEEGRRLDSKMEDSDEEFSPELLRKSLPEIQMDKQKKSKQKRLDAPHHRS